MRGSELDVCRPRGRKHTVRRKLGFELSQTAAAGPMSGRRSVENLEHLARFNAKSLDLIAQKRRNRKAPLVAAIVFDRFADEGGRSLDGAALAEDRSIEQNSHRGCL